MRVPFPFLLMDQSAKFQAVGRSKESAESINGATTIIPSLSERWRSSVTLLIKSRGARQQYEAFQACMEGRIGTALVPVHAQNRVLDQDGHPVSRCTVGTLSDAQTWEHFGFSVARVSLAVVLEEAALRATRLRISYGNSTGLRPGQKFTIGERLYEAQLIWNDGISEIVQFHPPLRVAAAVGIALVLDNPFCVMQFQSEEEGQVDYDQLAPGMQSITLNFVEVM